MPTSNIFQNISVPGLKFSSKMPSIKHIYLLVLRGTITWVYFIFDHLFAAKI